MPDTPATTEPPWPTASPLPVPEKARDVDLAKSYGRLVIRAGALRQRRAEEAREARERERRLLMTLIETDDDLLALQRGRRLSPSRASGVDAVRRRLHRRLGAFGVKEIELEGRAVNTAYAEIAGTEETDAVAPDTVVETMAACFVWQDEVLRPGRVFVAVPPSPEPPDENAPGDGDATGREDPATENQVAIDPSAIRPWPQLADPGTDKEPPEAADRAPATVEPSAIHPWPTQPADNGSECGAPGAPGAGISAASSGDGGFARALDEPASSEPPVGTQDAPAPAEPYAGTRDAPVPAAPPADTQDVPVPAEPHGESSLVRVCEVSGPGEPSDVVVPGETPSGLPRPGAAVSDVDDVASDGAVSERHPRRVPGKREQPKRSTRAQRKGVDKQARRSDGSSGRAR